MASFASFSSLREQAASKLEQAREAAAKQAAELKERATEKASSLREDAAAAASKAAEKATRLSEGVTDAALAVKDASASVGQILDDNDKVDDLLRAKNQRILDLEREWRARSEELDALKQRTVVKFKAMTAEKERLEERLRLAEAASAAAPPVTPTSATLISFDSPDGCCATPMTGGSVSSSVFACWNSDSIALISRSAESKLKSGHA